MEISFCDPRLCAVFNRYSLLQRTYDRSVAHSIAVRMGMLLAAPNLAAIPARPPIGLKIQNKTCTMSLSGGRKLQFRPLDGFTRSSTPILEKVTAIEIIEVLGAGR